MKDNPNGRQTQLKTISMEDNLKRRRPQGKNSSMDEYLKLTSIEALQEADNISLPS